MGTRRRRVSVIYFISKRDKWDDLRMEFISNCTADAISNAAKALKDGHLVAFPTETVYGLGADATNEKAVARIYSVKGRPTNHPLIVHISSINKLEDWATDIPDYAVNLARKFWPGPMTLILPRKDIAKDFITGGQNNVGLRVPNEPIALELLKKFETLGGKGVVAPSANRFGAVSPTKANDVLEELGAYFKEGDRIIDGGQCDLGLESTIVDCTTAEPRILRIGLLTRESIKILAGLNIMDVNKETKTKSSGMFRSHYAPSSELVVNAVPTVGDGLIALSKFPTPLGILRISAPNTIEEFSKNLYSYIRSADKLRLKRIVVIEPPGEGYAEAIRDRINKAAGSRKLLETDETVTGDSEKG
jgi:L-threonylcarbamoyladenylate synthase